MATDSIYVRKSALKRLEGVEGFIPMKKMRLRFLFAPEEYLPAIAPAQWRDKDEKLYMPVEHAAYLAKPDYIANTKKDLSPSTAPRHDDPLSRHRLSYLSGGGGSGKTTRAIELLLQRNPLVFTPTHRLAKEMRARGVQAQTCHSFFRWSGQTEWMPDRMGQKFIPRVIIWDEVCTVPAPPWKLSSTGSRVEASRSSAVATRDSRPLSPEKCPTTGFARLHSNLPTTMKR